VTGVDVDVGEFSWLLRCLIFSVIRKVLKFDFIVIGAQRAAPLHIFWRHLLFVAEGDDWVDAGGAGGRDGAGGDGYSEKQDGDGEEGAPVAGGYAVEQ
jgi:hypothetical protein